MPRLMVRAAAAFRFRYAAAMLFDCRAAVIAIRAILLPWRYFIVAHYYSAHTHAAFARCWLQR